MTNIKDASELLPLLRAARKDTGRIKIALSGTALEQLIAGLHMCETLGQKPDIPKLVHDLEVTQYQNLMYSHDVRTYVECIHHMIAGDSPCEYCEERNECQLTAKELGKGCQEWWLRWGEGRPQ